MSVAPSGVAFPNGTAERGIISRDGRQVMFAGKGSGFSDVLWIDPRGQYSVYVRDLGEGKTRALGSLSPTSLYNFGRGRLISDDGQRLLGFLKNRVVVIDQVLGTTNELVLPDGVVTSATLSPDGRWVAVEKRTDAYLPTNPTANHLWACDMATGGQVAVDLNAAGTGFGSGRSREPGLSRNGRYVVFVSSAEDLVPNDGNGLPDVFLRDLLTGATRLLSVNPRSNRSGNAPSLHPVWGADDHTVIFQSAASDLSDDDLNQTQDVFRVRIENPDGDGDGMDDAWEVAQFGNLDQDGRDDADGDGMSDGAEFKAGTLPLQRDSCLRMLRVTRNEGETSVEWTATSGRTYTVQSRSSIDASWRAAAASVTATGPVGSLSLQTAPEVQETYDRVMLVAP